VLRYFIFNKGKYSSNIYKYIGLKYLSYCILLPHGVHADSAILYFSVPWEATLYCLNVLPTFLIECFYFIQLCFMFILHFPRLLNLKFYLFLQSLSATSSIRCELTVLRYPLSCLHFPYVLPCIIVVYLLI
jgi:hypothetical protein